MALFFAVIGIILVTLSLYGFARTRPQPKTVIVCTSLRPSETSLMTDDELDQFRPSELDSQTWIKTMRTRESRRRIKAA